MAGAAAIAQKRAKEFQQLFNEKGAISPETAMTLEELGLDKGKSNTFYIMVMKNHIVKVGDRYYFHNDGFDDRAVKKLKDFITDLFEELKD